MLNFVFFVRFCKKLRFIASISSAPAWAATRRHARVARRKQCRAKCNNFHFGFGGGVSYFVRRCKPSAAP
jgi:hypothetical protein